VKYKETREKLLQLYLVKQKLVRSEHISWHLGWGSSSYNDRRWRRI